MEPFAIEDLIERGRGSDDLFTEFLRRDSMSLGIYRLPAGTEDPQSPHAEDEVYLVLEGEAGIRIGDSTHPVEEGSVIFVERNVDHRFVDVEEDLTLLVFFAPAEGSLSGE